METTIPSLTPRAFSILSAADSLSKGLGHDYVGCEHLLLALLDSEDNVASAAFSKAGTGGATKAALMEIVNSAAYSTPSED